MLAQIGHRTRNLRKRSVQLFKKIMFSLGFESQSLLMTDGYARSFKETFVL